MQWSLTHVHDMTAVTWHIILLKVAIAEWVHCGHKR